MVTTEQSVRALRKYPALLLLLVTRDPDDLALLALYVSLLLPPLLCTSHQPKPARHAKHP